MKRFRATPSKLHDNCYNVVDMEQKNKDGEPFAIVVALTEQEAKKLADELNKKTEQ